MGREPIPSVLFESAGYELIQELLETDSSGRSVDRHVRDRLYVRNP